MLGSQGEINQMNTKPTVLLVGASGMLGRQIASALLDRGETRVKALVRNPTRTKELRDLTARGMEVTPGDILRPETLGPATEGVTAIISAVGNDEQLIVEGQTNLLRAAEANQVKRFIPSDFALDYRKLSMGDSVNLDMRKKFLPRLLDSTVAHTSILNGAFMEMIQYGTVDPEKGLLNYWGDGHQKLDFTHSSDAAKYTAAAVADPAMANEVLQVVGEETNYVDLAETYFRATGKRLNLNRLGSTDDLKAWIEKTKGTAQNPWDYIGAQYTWAMVTGLGKLLPMNSRYPEIRPMGVEAFLRV